MKTVSVRDLVQKGTSKVIAGAEDEPVLVTRNGEPAAWVIGANWLAAASAGRGDLYEQALVALAIDLYDKEVLSMGKAAELSGLPLLDFITAAGRAGVPVWRLPPGGLSPQVEALERLLDSRSSLTSASPEERDEEPHRVAVETSDARPDAAMSEVAEEDPFTPS